MFNKIIKYKFWISGGIIFILGAWYIGTMLKWSGIAGKEEGKKTLLEQAKEYYLDGEYKKAINLYEKVLILEPNNSTAILDLAVLYDDYLNLDDKAVELYKRYIELEPKSKKSVIVEGLIKETAQESLGLSNPEIAKIKQLENELNNIKKENELLKEETQTLSSKLYTIQADHEKEIKSLQEERERITGELSSARIKIGKLTRELANSENSKKNLLQQLEETIKKEKASKIKSNKIKADKI